ncbi:MAG: RDD family protein [Myxococcota bacterium]
MTSTTSAPPVSLDGTHTVLTPEYVEFNFVLAGLMSRFLAWLIDTLIAAVIALGVILVLSVSMTLFPGFGSALSFVVWFLIDWGYMTFLELVWSGQTIGKRAMGLRVIQESGVRVGFYQSFLRALGRLIDRPIPLPFYTVGAVFALFSARHQRLGDMLGGTIVVRERRLKIPAALERPEGDTSLLNDSDFRARVGRLSAEEEAVLFNAALRREELGMEARLSLFATLARRLEEDLGFVKPAHLSDEKLVLLVTAALAARNAQRRKAAPPRRFFQR